MKNLLITPLVALGAILPKHSRAIACLLLAVSAAAPHAWAQWSVVSGSLGYGGNASFQYAGTFPDVSYTFWGAPPTYVAYVFRNPDGTEKGWSGPMGGTPGAPVPAGANGIWDQYGTYTVEFWYLENPSLGVFVRQTLVSTYQFTVNAPNCRLTTGTAGSGSGSVTPASSDYPVGSTVNVTATAGPDSRFDHWVIAQGGTVLTPNPTAATYPVTMSADTTATAYFEPTTINVSFALQNTSVTYSGGAAAVTVLPSDSGAQYTVTYSGSSGAFGPYACNGPAAPPGPASAGTYAVTITGTGEYVNVTPNPVGSFTIAPAPVTFSFGKTTNTYTGRTFAATVTPSTPGATFTGSLDYGPNVGTSTVSVVATGNYTGSGQASASVTPAFTGFTFGNTSQTYNGGTFTATVMPSNPAATFTANASYGPDVGTTTVSATATGNYSGTGQASATVLPAFVSFTFSNTDQTYTGSVLSATVTPSPATATFTASLTGGPAVGSYALSAAGTGNYTGSGSGRLNVLPATPFRSVLTSASPVSAGRVNGAGVYAQGSSATVTAIPDATHVFANWSGDASGPQNPLTFTVGGQDYHVVANFVPIVTSATVKYQSASHALWDSATTRNGVPLVIKGS